MNASFMRDLDRYAEAILRREKLLDRIGAKQRRAKIAARPAFHGVKTETTLESFSS